MEHQPAQITETFQTGTSQETDAATYMLNDSVEVQMETRNEFVLLSWFDESAVDALANALRSGALSAREYTMFPSDDRMKIRRRILSNRWTARQISNADLGTDSLIAVVDSPTVKYTLENNEFTGFKPELSIRSDDWHGAFADAELFAQYGPSENASLVAANKDGLVHRFLNP